MFAHPDCERRRRLTHVRRQRSRAGLDWHRDCVCVCSRVGGLVSLPGVLKVGRWADSHTNTRTQSHASGLKCGLTFNSITLQTMKMRHIKLGRTQHAVCRFSAAAQLIKHLHIYCINILNVCVCVCA